MKFEKNKLEGVFEIFPSVFEDERGYFFESYNEEAFKAQGIDDDFVQDNQSKSSKGVLRGLHFQNPPYAQCKLVRVTTGSALDVIVDLRKESPTYGQHQTFLLESTKHNMVLVPEGFAHGFVALEDDTTFCYKCSNLYNKKSEGGLKWDDSTLNIDWQVGKYIVSEKDQELPGFDSFVSQF